VSDLLRQRPNTTGPMLAVWDDAQVLAHALRFEAALARAQADVGVIPAEAADHIARACSDIRPDPAELAEEAALAGTLAIPLVKRLRAAVPESARDYVHHASTSQDMADTITMMQARAGAKLLDTDTRRILAALAPLARKHAHTPAMGRTLGQDALPIALGLRLAQWHAGVADASAEFSRVMGKYAVLQFGGAVGTRTGNQGEGAAVAERLGQMLGLPAAPPWHARRSGVALIGSTLAALTGASGKLARDIAFSSQNALGEMREPQVAGRGGSSAMAHKRNPTGCQIALSAAARAPGLASTLLAGLPAEQERGLGGWQAEAPVLADLFCIASGSLAALAEVVEGLEIDTGALADRVPDGDADLGESAVLIDTLLRIGEE